MEIAKTFLARGKIKQKEGMRLILLTVKGEPSKNNLFEQYIAHAARLGYTLKQNAEYTAIEFKGRGDGHTNSITHTRFTRYGYRQFGICTKATHLCCHSKHRNLYRKYGFLA